MGEVRGFGISHYPPIQGKDATMIETLKRNLRDPDIPEAEKDPANWPESMRKDWEGMHEEGFPSGATHRAALVRNFDRVRAALDEFKPDIVIMWGDDQYELFREEIIPPFCVLAFEDTVVRPFASKSPYRPDAWDEGPEHERTILMDREIGKYFVRGLLAENFDIAYAYKPRADMDRFPHAFLNGIMYLDYHRTGFPYKTLPISVNCYGSHVIANHGGGATVADTTPLDPPSPTPDRCMQLGAAIARVAEASPYKVALVASSGWSHAFLNDKAWKLQPDVVADRRLYDAIVAQDYKFMHNYTVAEIEDAGEQECLNWFCLAGAMEQLDRKPVYTDFVETLLFNSTKVFAVYE